MFIILSELTGKTEAYPLSIGHIMDDDILWKKQTALTDMKMCDVPCRLTTVNKDLEMLSSKAMDYEFI